MLYLLAALAAVANAGSMPPGEPKTQTCTPRPGPIDVYFLLDGSTSIGPDMWQNKLFFISTLIQASLTHPDDRAGVVQWSNKPPIHHFSFDDSLEQVAFEINQINQLYGSTKTDNAVHRGLKFFQNETPPPSPRPQVMLLVTDGEPNPTRYDPCLPGNEYNLPAKLRKKEAEEDFIFAIIGIGRDPDFSKLDCLVADPTVNTVVIRDFTSFDDYRDPTGGLLCVDDPDVFATPTPAPTTPFPTELPTMEPSEMPTIPTPYPTQTPAPTHLPSLKPTGLPTYQLTEPPVEKPTSVPTEYPVHDPTTLPTEYPVHDPTTLPTEVPVHDPTALPTEKAEPPTSAPTHCEPRLEPIDVYFAVDGSGSIKDWQWKNLQFFLSTIAAEALNVPGDRLGLMQWSSKKPRWEYSFDDTIDFFKENVYTMQQMMGATKTDYAMNYALKLMKADNEENPPSPPNKKQVLVIITDGIPNPISYGPCSPESLAKYDLPVKIALTANLDVAVIGIGRGELDFKSVFKCVVEDPDENIIRIRDFTSFDDYRDPTDGLLCVDPDVFITPTPAPTNAPETPAPTEAGECDGGDLSPNAALIQDFKKCLSMRSMQKCNKKAECRWANEVCGLRNGGDKLPTPSTCMADWCAQYKWFGPSDQCTWTSKDGCGCALYIDKFSCNGDMQCNWGDDCTCHPKDVCDGLDFNDCLKRSKRCDVCGDLCVPKCELGPGQDKVEGLQAVLDHDTCKCKLQTVRGTCGCVQE